MLPTNMQMFIWCTCLLTNMQMQISHYRDPNTISLRCKFPCRDVNAKSIHDDTNAPLRRCKCKSLFFDIKMPLAGMPWRKYSFSWRKCNLTKNSFYFLNRGFLGAWNQNAFKTRFIFSKILLFYFDEAWMSMHHSCPKNMFYFDLRLPKKWWSPLEISLNETLIRDQVIWLENFHFHNLVEKMGGTFSRPFSRN